MQPNILYAGPDPHMPEEPIWTNLGITLDQYDWTAEKVSQEENTVVLRIVEEVRSWTRDDDGPCPSGHTGWFYRVLDPNSNEYQHTDVLGEESSHEAMMVARQFLRLQQIKLVTWRDQAGTSGKSIWRSMAFKKVKEMISQLEVVSSPLPTDGFTKLSNVVKSVEDL